MKLSIAILATAITTASAFAPTMPVSMTKAASASASASASVAPTALFAGEPEEEGFDLNLEEMFDIFDAADNDENFDDAIDKVKGGDKK